jgi:hypothetical protein
VTTPPATRTPLGAPWWYRAAVVVIAIVLIATQAINTWTIGIFDTQNAVLWGVTGLAISWAWWDAWRTRRGVLHYADGQWVLALGDVEYQGTIQPVVDLPRYSLVKFTPVSDAAPLQIAHGSYKKEYSQQCQEKWLHLEPQFKLPTAAADWLALRRAVFARPQHNDMPSDARQALS